MKTFTKSPAAVVVTTDEGQFIWLGREVIYGPDPGGEAPQVATIFTRDSVKHVGMSSVDRDVPGEVIAKSWPGGFEVHIREALPSDAVSSPVIASTVPLPLEVISTMVSDTIDYYGAPMAVSLHALTKDDGFVSTMMLMAPTGIYARYDRAWIKIQDPDIMDGLNVVDVRDEALAFYDEYDQIDQSIHVAMMPLSDGETLDRFRPVVPDENTTVDDDGVPVIDDSPPPEKTEAPTGLPAPPMVASAVKIRTIDDLPAAITAAAEDESIRWYVEKRAKAFGYEEALPW